MNRALLMALAGLLMTMGCGQANSPAEHRESRGDIESSQKEANEPESPAKLAEHRVTKKKGCRIASQTATCYSVSTDATSGEAFAALTRNLRKQSGGDDNVVVTFFFDEPRANSSGRGFAFESEEAARDVLSRVLPQERYLRDEDLNEEVSKSMQNDGIYVISVADELAEEMCAAWDPRSLGPPPKQWDCAGLGPASWPTSRRRPPSHPDPQPESATRAAIANAGSLRFMPASFPARPSHPCP
jgi:hypothetical protein